jgi:hypothetical protein
MPLPGDVLAPRTPHRAIVRELTIARDLDLALDPALARDLDVTIPTLNRALDRDLTKALSRVGELERSQFLSFPDTAHSIDSALRRELGLELAQALERAIDVVYAGERRPAPDIDPALSFDLDLDLARVHDPELDRALDRALHMALGLASDLARALGYADDNPSCRALSAALATIREWTRAFHERNVSAAVQMLSKPTRAIANHAPRRDPLTVMLRDLLAKVAYNTPRNRQQASYLFFAHIAKHAWLARDDSSDDTGTSLLDMHWWACVTMARVEGKLPAWEAIRLVRECRR